jgi:uncharacterized protein VirK/YbjX
MMIARLRLLLTESIFFKKLVMNQVIQDTYWDSKSNRLKFVLRTMMQPKSSFKVLGFLATVPNVKSLVARQPSLPFKVHRPYLNAKMKTKEKIKSICDGNRLIHTSIKKETYENIFSKKGLALGEIDGKSERYSIHIGMENKFSREGELVLHIKDESEIILSSCAFGFTFENEQPSMFIGAIQGGGEEHTHQLIRKATKSCYGLFPKRILIEVAYLIANKFGCKKIFAVSNQTHVFQNKRYKRKKNDLMVSNYDEFWVSLACTKNEDNNYELPGKLKRKQVEEIPSKKRSEYRKRYDLLDKLHGEILMALN